MVPWPTCYEIVAKYGGEKSLSGKIAIVTGSNTGIGLETAASLYAAGATVIMACRNMKACEEAIKTHRILSTADPTRVIPMTLDLGSLKSVNVFANEFAKRFPQFDILVNNAGLGFQGYTTTSDGLEQTFGVNHIGHFHLTNLLVPLMREKGRIVIVSSESHRQVSASTRENILNNMQKHFNPSADDYSMNYTYSTSKLANVLHANELNKRLQKAQKNITVNSLHPGTLIYTSFGRTMVVKILFWLTSFFTMNVEQGAATTVYCCIAPELEGVGGQYFENVAKRNASRLGVDEELMAKFWAFSEDIVASKLPKAAL